ncbi:MAG: adenylyltransferase/cytidyltransferase family protein [Phycisphaerae bacterium]
MNRPYQRKIVTADTLAQQLRQQQAAGRRIVQCHGCFDIVHPGHVRYLQSACELGDVLVVSLTADAGISKGPDRPYIPQELRAENLAALEFVDWVVIDTHPTACELLETLRPDVYVKGREYATSSDSRFLREREIVERGGGRVVFHSGDVVFSSTQLIQNIESEHDLEECRLRALCQRHEIDPTAINRCLASFTGSRVVIVGDTILERYIACDAGQSAADAPMLDLRKLAATEYWGGAAALALQLQALGACPTLITHVGSDAASQALRDRLCQLGIEHHLIPGRPSLVERTTYVADDAKLMRIDDGTCSPLDVAQEREAAGVTATTLASANAILWCEYGYGAVTPALAKTVNAIAKHAGAYRAGYAPGVRGQLDSMIDCDFLSLSERRVRESVSDMTSSLPAVMWNVLSRTHTSSAIVSLHKRGLLGFASEEEGKPLGRLKSEFVPSMAAHNVDLLGCEEAIIAAATLALSHAASLPLATYIAAASSALAAGRMGRSIVRLRDLHTLLTHRAELRPEGRFVAEPRASIRGERNATLAESNELSLGATGAA